MKIKRVILGRRKITIIFKKEKLVAIKEYHKTIWDKLSIIILLIVISFIIIIIITTFPAWHHSLPSLLSETSSKGTFILESYIEHMSGVQEHNLFYLR